MNATALPASSVRDESNRFYVAMGLLILATVATAFSQRYFARPFLDVAPLPVHVHVHAVLFTCWILLFVAQATLVRYGWLRDHRRVGIAGTVLAVSIIAVGIYSAIAGARNGHNPGHVFPNALAFLVIGLGDIALFALFVSSAILWRHRPEWHKRLMLFATLGGFLWPSITRLPFATGRFPVMIGILAIMVFLPALHDLFARRRLHPLNIAGALIILVSIPLRRVIAMSDAWQQFAARLVG